MPHNEICYLSNRQHSYKLKQCCPQFGHGRDLFDCAWTDVHKQTVDLALLTSRLFFVYIRFAKDLSPTIQTHCKECTNFTPNLHFSRCSFFRFVFEINIYDALNPCSLLR